MKVSSFMGSVVLAGVFIAVFVGFDFGLFGGAFLTVWWFGTVIKIWMSDISDRSKASLNADYEEALRQLEENPWNSQLRRNVVQVGRKKAQYLQRIAEDNGEGDTYFTETSIRNDIDVICNGKSSSVPGMHSISEEITKLHRLKQDGLITAADLEAIKKRITGGPDNVDQAIRLIRGLGDLRKEGTLTEGEFNIKKWDILSKKLMQ